MVAHTLTCPDCVRYNDEDMTVKMCDAAKVLNNAYRDAFDIAKPYMAIIEADAQRMNE